MSKNGTFDRKPWYDEINDIIDKRSRQCGLNGDGYIYDVPLEAFNTKRSGFEFEREFPFNFKQHCKRPKRDDLKETDKHKRFFKKVFDKNACKVVRGVWDPATTNRANRYGRGTCWVNDTEAHCGRYGAPAIIRRENPTNKDFILKEANRKCNADNKCTWFKPSGNSPDCVSKSIIDSLGSKVETPPNNMPVENLEPFLQEWYVDKKHATPPSTKELFGTGDRCNNSGASPSPSKKFSDIMNIDILALDLKKFNDQKNLRKILETMGYPAVENTMRKLINQAKVPPLDGVQRSNPLKDIKKEFEQFLVDEALMQADDSNNGFLPSVPQSVVNMIMKNIAIKNADQRGIMALHSTGSGKTCTATGVMDAFWDTNRQIVFASSIDAVASNPPFKFHECASRLFPRFKRDPFNANLENIAKEFEDRAVVFLPFAKLANRIVKTEKFKSIIAKHLNKKGGAKKKTSSTAESHKNTQRKSNNKSTNKIVVKAIADKIPKGTIINKLIDHIQSVYHIDRIIIYNALKQANITSRDDYIDLDNTCLIIDEVHNLFRPLPMQREKHRIVEKHIVDPSVHPNLKVVILTATPGDNVADTIKLLNIVRNADKPPITSPDVNDSLSITQFKNSIRGLVSFFDMSADTTQFPVVFDKGPIKLPMSNKQFEKYVEAYKEVKDSFKEYDKLAKANQLHKFWQGPRKYANMLFSFDKGLQLSEFSSKLPALLDNVNNAPKEKHYIYSSFYENRGSGQGILEIARQLEANGYTKLTVKEAKEWNKKGIMPPKAKRYVLALQKDIGDEGSSSAGNNLAQLIKIFNHRDNKYGDFVHVFLATQGFNEGIDLKAVRHIHFFEPLITMASDLQTIGRARRFCSHADLDRDKGEWSVQIHRYLSDFPINANFNDTDSLNIKIKELKDKIEYNNDIWQKLKGLKNEQIAEQFGFAGYKETVKRTLADDKLALKETEKNLKKAIKEDISSIKNIDDFVFNNAIDKMKELFTIHLAIKQAAVDCRLLNKFHNSLSTESFSCAF